MIELNKRVREMILFPLNDYKKDPKVRWKTYTQGLTESTITYGINCELSGIVVIDVDIHNETNNGVANWMNLVSEGDLDTFTVATPNNGYHYYYITKNSKLIKSNSGKIAKGIDVRSAGGYVVGPGSKVKDNNGEIKEYIITSDIPIAPLPTWIEDLLLAEIIDNKKTIDDESTEHFIEKVEISPNDFKPDNELVKDLAATISHLMEAEEGTRNNTLNKFVYRLFERHDAPKEFIEKRIKPIALAMGLEVGEINSTIEGAYEAAKERKDGLVDSPVNTELADYTDVVLSVRFGKELKKNNIISIIGENEWLKYSTEDGIWKPYEYDELFKMCKKWCEEEVNRAAQSKDRERIKRSLRCLTNNTVIAVCKLVKVEVLESKKNFNNDPELICCLNGVVDLRTANLMPFDKDYFMTKKVRANFDETVKSKYLDSILDALPEDAIDWFVSIAGQALTGYKTSDDRMFVLNGIGANGKSTLLNILAETAGDYNGFPSQDSLMRSKNNDNHNLMSYKDIHQAIIEELPDKQLDTVRMKSLLGTETITARALYKNNETFKLKCTIFVSNNILPQVTEYDDGTWRRLALIPFNKVYKFDDKDITLDFHRKADERVRWAALHDQDTKTEFFTRRVLAASEWLTNDRRVTKLPESIKKATYEWKVKGDTFHNWFDKHIELDYNYFILIEDLRDDFNRLLEEEGYSTISHKVFLERFSNHAVFTGNNLHIKRGVTTDLQQSFWEDPKKCNDKNYMHRTSGRTPTHVKGIKFK